MLLRNKVFCTDDTLRSTFSNLVPTMLQVGILKSMSAPVSHRPTQPPAALRDLPYRHLSHQLSRKRSKSNPRSLATANSAEGSAENFGPGNDSLLSG